MILCGIGTLGAHLAESLVRAGWDNFTVIDCDRVEARNLQNQPYGRADVGRPKTKALCEMLHRATGARVHGIERKITVETAPRLLSGADLVVDALDNHAARAAVQVACRSLDLPLLHLGMSRDGYGEVRWDARYEVPPDASGDACADPLSRQLAMLVVVAATEVLQRQSSHGWMVTQGDLAFSRI